MLNFHKTRLEKTIIHKIGIKSLDEGIQLSDNVLERSDNQDLNQVLYNYFLSSFKEPLFYSFSHPSDDLELHDIFQIVSKLFSAPSTLAKASATLAQILYDCSDHPKIKAGELYVTYFKDVVFGDDTTDAIGIFKSENKQTFLKIEHAINTCNIDHLTGINTQKLDKGALIINTNSDEGYKIAIVDNLNFNEAQYWKTNFLKLKPCSDSYNNTKNALQVTREFISQMPEEFNLTKTDQLDFMNKSINYFKENESFNKRKFESEVFEDKEVIDSFRKFGRQYPETDAINLDSNFEISNSAVKKQSKVYKSILKLDKNFHIYIHGDHNLIEKGEEDGRKFYKIYFDRES
jgi:hypothetical protein